MSMLGYAQKFQYNIYIEIFRKEQENFPQSQVSAWKLYNLKLKLTLSLFLYKQL